MSLGATMSAPASTCDTAVRASSSSALIVVHLAVDDHAAVAVRRVLAEADVGHQHELREARPRARGARAARSRRPPTRRSPARPSPRGSRTGSRPGRRAARAPRPRGRASSTVWRAMPGSSSFPSDSGATKSGITNWSRPRRVSRTSARSVGFRRKRRSRTSGKSDIAQRVRRGRLRPGVNQAGCCPHRRRP